MQSGAGRRKTMLDIERQVQKGREREEKWGYKVLRPWEKRTPEYGGQVGLQYRKEGSREQRRRELLILWEAPPVGPPVA